MLTARTASTVSQLQAQWSNPGDVLSLLLIIGGDIVQKALAQTTAGRVPSVCFSFGWVAYSFTTLVGVVGDGRLLPQPDYPVKVFNLESSYVRENKNWIIGRILRDNEVFMNRFGGLRGAGIRISIYTATPGPKKRWTYNFITEILWLFVTLLQLGIAAIPLALDNEWGVFLITASGVVAAILAGVLPQWNVEKVPLKRRSEKYIALTSGNGSREIMVIYGAGNALDLEELAAAESPRSDRVWEALPLFSKLLKDEHGEPLYHHRSGNEMRRTYMYWGLPVGLWVTRIACFCQAIFWVALLITVAGLRSHSWYLVLVGSLGMLQNAMVVAVARSPDRRGLPLEPVDKIVTNRAMDGLMDLECTIEGSGQVLLDEFFPGFLREDEQDWWSGKRDYYDDKRISDGKRGRPRSRMPKISIDIPDIDRSGKAHLYRRTSSLRSLVPSGDMEMMPVAQRPISRDFEPGIQFSAKRPDEPSPSDQTQTSRLPARNDRLNKQSQDSVRSPDWA